MSEDTEKINATWNASGKRAATFEWKASTQILLTITSVSNPAVSIITRPAIASIRGI